MDGEGSKVGRGENACLSPRKLYDKTLIVGRGIVDALRVKIGHPLPSSCELAVSCCFPQRVHCWDFHVRRGAT